jgi:DNA (cytosine-5)-methyltransferase 1
MMKFLDLFAGVGGFRRGLELAGHECVGFCEWDKFAAASYTSMHLITDEQRSRLATMDLKKRQKEILKEEYRNGEWYSADVRLITADNIPRADCWCFGAPCQDFSVAGLRKGLDGDRSSLVREVFRVLGELKEEDRPEWLIYENVKGMLSSNRGADFGAIILEMGELGYDIEWELFNSKNFGVPQNRERVYTIGHLRSRGRHQILPLKGADREDSVRVEPECIGGIGEKNFGTQFQQQNRIYDGHKVATALTSNLSGNVNYYAFGIDKNVQGSETECANALTAREDRGVSNFKQTGTAVAIPVLTPDRAEKRQNGRRFKDNGEDMFTLTSQDRHGVGVSIPIREAVSKGYTEAQEGDSINLTMPDNKTRRGRVGKKQAQTLDCGCNQGIIVKLNDNDTVYAVWYEKYQCYIAIRKLTPRECFRLQGWTDAYFEKAAFVNSDSQLYKQAGNGVTVNVVQAIGEAIKGD